MSIHQTPSAERLLPEFHAAPNKKRGLGALDFAKTTMITLVVITMLPLIFSTFLGSHFPPAAFTLMGSINLSLCAGLMISWSGCVMGCGIDDKSESRAAQLAKILAFLAPIILVNVLAIHGVSSFVSPMLDGWTLGVAYLGLTALSYCTHTSQQQQF
jgi:hypothetical protein